jgi:hypothetical protein
MTYSLAFHTQNTLTCLGFHSRIINRPHLTIDIAPVTTITNTLPHYTLKDRPTRQQSKQRPQWTQIPAPISLVKQSQENDYRYNYQKNKMTSEKRRMQCEQCFL